MKFKDALDYLESTDIVQCGPLYMRVIKYQHRGKLISATEYSELPKSKYVDSDTWYKWESYILNYSEIFDYNWRIATPKKKIKKYPALIADFPFQGYTKEQNPYISRETFKTHEEAQKYYNSHPGEDYTTRVLRLVTEIPDLIEELEVEE